MIEVYSYDTGNGQRPRILLEELGIPYRLHWVDLAKGAQRDPAYLALNPTGRIPTLVDPDGPGGERVVLTQSLAMLTYLADKAGRLIPSDPAGRTRTLEAMYVAATDVQPGIGAAFYLSYMADEKMPDAGAAMLARSAANARFLEDMLAERTYLAGEAYGIADIAAFTVVATLKRMGADLSGLPRLERWYGEVAARPAVQRGCAVPGA